MKRTTLILILWICVSALLFSACAIFTPKNVKTTLDVANAACVLFHDEVEDVKILGELCGISEDFWPEVRDLVAARKQAASRKAAMRTSTDAGAGN